jgi:hypothetical protein
MKVSKKGDPPGQKGDIDKAFGNHYSLYYFETNERLRDINYDFCDVETNKELTGGRHLSLPNHKDQPY